MNTNFNAWERLHSGRALATTSAGIQAGAGALAVLESVPEEHDMTATVSVCDTQPVTAEGIRTLLASHPGLDFLEAPASLTQALEHVRRATPNVLMLDKAFGMQAILEWLAAAHSGSFPMRTAVVIWGVSITEAEALRFLQAGARGILRKTASVPVIASCLRTVAAGRSWMEDSVFREPQRNERYPRSELTSREQQVLELVEQGLKNKEIARELGIRPGTVKIHLKHIFEKTGVRDRKSTRLNSSHSRASRMPSSA